MRHSSPGPRCPHHVGQQIDRPADAWTVCSDCDVLLAAADAPA